MPTTMPSFSVQLQEERRPDSPNTTAERLTFGTYEDSLSQENKRENSAPARKSRKSAIPRAPVPSSPREGDRSDLQRTAAMSIPLPPTVANNSQPQGSIPTGKGLHNSSYYPRASPHKHTASMPLSPPRKTEHHQRNYSAPSVQGRHSRQGSTSSAGAKEICRYFLRTGTCGYGNKCRYDHPKSAHKPNLNSLGYPLRDGECVCKFFVKNGWCGFGATCKFDHPEPPQRPPQPPVMPHPHYPSNVYPPPPAPIYPVHHPGMYPGMMPPSSVGPPPMMPVPHGMYNPYLYMKGMPPMMPPVPWMAPPPVGSAGGSLHSRDGSHGVEDQGTESDVSTSSVVLNGQKGNTELLRQASYSSSDVPSRC